jgi:hypothetical protein
MSLPASQRRALGSIEGRLGAADPHLASMFAIFARLSDGEPVPTERLAIRPRPWRRPRLAACAVALIPLMFIAMIAVSALAGISGTPRACLGDHPAGGVTPLVRPACQLTADTTAVKAASAATPDANQGPACIDLAWHGRPARGWVCLRIARDGGPVADRAPRA